MFKQQIIINCLNVLILALMRFRHHILPNVNNLSFTCQSLLLFKQFNAFFAFNYNKLGKKLHL